MSVVDEVKSRLDIVDTVSGYVALRKSGRYFKAQCPFHTEKTPSFTVNPERQAWHCFGACATGGDVFSFVMRMERLDFGEALRLLADRAGVPLTERRDRDRSGGAPADQPDGGAVLQRRCWRPTRASTRPPISRSGGWTTTRPADSRSG